MPDDRETGRAGRHLGSIPVVPLLLAAILVALVVLIVVTAAQRADDPQRTGSSGISTRGSSTVATDGETVRRSDLSQPPRSPRAIDDPNRIRETLRPGKSYRVVVKAGLDARAEDKAWWRKEVINVSYLAEMAIDRTIESNDGKRVVELRRFVAARNTKLLCDVESARIDLGPPGVLMLGMLNLVRPDAGTVLAVAAPIANAILRSGAQEVARSATSKAVARVDSLSGKSIRITYVDGIGVESIVPVGCTLDEDEKLFLFETAVLSDCFLWDMKRAPGARWKVDGSQLSGLIDPSLRGTTGGEIALVRDSDVREDGKTYAALRIEGGLLSINGSDASRRRIGEFAPEGTLHFGLEDRVVERASLSGRMRIEEVSTDHILFETSFRSRPILRVEYSCTVH